MSAKKIYPYEVMTIYGPGKLIGANHDQVCVCFNRLTCTNEEMKKKYSGKFWNVMIDRSSLLPPTNRSSEESSST